MVQPTAGLVAVATGADYMREPQTYDPERSWQDAVAAVGGSGATAFARFAAQHRGHPLLEGAIEAPELGDRIAGAFGGAADAASRSALRDELEQLAGTEAALDATLSDPALASEIAPWAAKLTALSRASLVGLDALDGNASSADYRAARDAALSSPLDVAKDDLSDALGELLGGLGAQVHHTDRFADLFAAIDARLASGGS
jgi:hyaluronoglucosaminidase